MYQRYVLAALVRELSLSLVFLVPIVAVYLMAGFHREKGRGCYLALLSIVFGTFSLLSLWASKDYLYDFAQYLRRGDVYVRTADCRLEDALSGTAEGIVKGVVRMYCAGGDTFVVLYRWDYQRRIWRWRWQVLRVRYLPRSHVVLDLER